MNEFMNSFLNEVSETLRSLFYIFFFITSNGSSNTFALLVSVFLRRKVSEKKSQLAPEISLISSLCNWKYRFSF